MKKNKKKKKKDKHKVGTAAGVPGGAHPPSGEGPETTSLPQIGPNIPDHKASWLEEGQMADASA
jgi:hypothetical protein